ncbi:hypothetical protein [Calothrix sp. 336/3]|uniref:hypothetical protein n=1 Tax=Calothrix sp. 336/3 TaxID=1337936 RepID=UPI0004E2E56E|nr:hypothetical protein [Calothrix sp. 336/3]AKG22908.1 hypothetical protein IJ00_17955 [Calothrix sp. 336/3]
MNESDTPNHGDLMQPHNSTDAPQKQQVSCPFYNVLPSEKRITSQIPLLSPASQENHQIQQLESSVESPHSNIDIQENSTITTLDVESSPVVELFPKEAQQLESSPVAELFPKEAQQIESSPVAELFPEKPQQIESSPISELTGEQTTQSVQPPDWIAEPDIEKQKLIDTEFQKLLELNQELQSANNNLYTQVAELTSALSESEKTLQKQKQRTSIAESILNQQTQELTAAQEQITSLFQQLETALQTAQHQETLAETYKAQLELNQQRLAQLERECSLLQTKYSEQSHQLMQSENSCRELRTRLMRQQRQTLQFKAALEKCLETSVPGEETTDTTSAFSDNIQKKRYSQLHTSLISHAQPIKPWSKSLEFSDDELENPWDEPIIPANSPTSATTDLTEIAKKFVPNSEVKEPASANVDSHTKQPENLGEQLENVIQMFFAHQNTSIPSQPPTLHTPVTDTQEFNQEIVPIWETFSTPLHDEEEEETLITTTINVETNPPQSTDFWLEVSQLSQPEASTPETQQSFEVEETANNSPSPLIYPQRQSRGRKTLAAVELPNFRKNG